MAVAPKFAAHALNAPTIPVHTLELLLRNEVRPLVDQKYPGKVQFIFRHQVQPWHPSSTLTHEAGLAVEQVDPSKYWMFSAALFDKQAEYFDTNVVNETRNNTYERLSTLASSVGVDKDKVYNLLKVSDEPVDGAYNIGNQTTNDLKLHVKAARLTGIHVSPTVVFDGVIENTISSGWDVNQWAKWLEKNMMLDN